MQSFGLKAWDDDDIRETKSILESFVAGDQEQEEEEGLPLDGVGQ